MTRCVNCGGDHNSIPCPVRLGIFGEVKMDLTREELKKILDAIPTQSVQVTNCSFEMLRWIEDGPEAVRGLLAELSRLTLIAAKSQREVERLRGELANANRESAFRGKSWSACADRLQGVRAERDKLMSALRPFAAFACDTFCGCYNCIAKEALAEAVRDE